MVSPTAWNEHFGKMARRGISPEDTVVISHRSRGLGRSGMHRTSYKIREPSTGAPPPVALVTPTAQGVLRAKEVLKKKKGIKGKSTHKKQISKKKKGKETTKSKKAKTSTKKK